MWSLLNWCSPTLVKLRLDAHTTAMMITWWLFLCVSWASFFRYLPCLYLKIIANTFMSKVIGCSDFWSFDVFYLFIPVINIAFCNFCASIFVSQSLLPDYQRLLSSMPNRRLNASKLIDNSGEFFNFLLVLQHTCGEIFFRLLSCTMFFVWLFICHCFLFLSM